jgi:hypothetical protein
LTLIHSPLVAFSGPSEAQPGGAGTCRGRPSPRPTSVTRRKERENGEEEDDGVASDMYDPPTSITRRKERENREEEDDGVASDMYTHSVKLDNSTIDTVRGVQELVLIL